jgi:hypothetical protein
MRGGTIRAAVPTISLLAGKVCHGSDVHDFDDTLATACDDRPPGRFSAGRGASQDLDTLPALGALWVSAGHPAGRGGDAGVDRAVLPTLASAAAGANRPPGVHVDE